MKMKWFMASCLMLVICARGQLPAQETNTNSVESIRTKAENGDAQSQTAMGAIYELGLHGVPTDVVEAMNWFRRAAEQNFAPAQYELGTCFANGQGLKKDKVEAVKWYLKAASQNLAVAQYNVGVCYRDGQGVAKDEEEAVIWFRKAADQNLAIAQYNLGVCYDNGQGVVKDTLKAVKWYRKAADQNLAYAECNLAAHYEHGVGVAEDHVEASKLYRKSAEQNYALAQYNLAACYANGQGVAQDAVEAVKWYRLAAEQNNALAQCNLGTCYGNAQGVAKDAVQAVKWFRKAADQNDSLAQYNLGIYYYNGYGVAQNETEAYIWFSLSAAQGDLDASRSRNIIAAHLSQAGIAEAQKRINSFTPGKENTEDRSIGSTNPTTLSNQLTSWPLPETANQNGEKPSHTDNIGTPQAAVTLPKQVVVKADAGQGQEQEQSHGIAFIGSFLGTTNFCIPSDNVISMKTDTLKFQIDGITYDYSGHYCVMLNTPRKHKNPSFGFGTPDKAKLIIIDDFGGDAMPLPDSTIWEKSKGFIDVEALGKEWIYSGTYTIQK
jgi:TPR repeat protein